MRQPQIIGKSFTRKPYRNWLLVTLIVLAFSGCHPLHLQPTHVEYVYSTNQPVQYFCSKHFRSLLPSRVVITTPSSRDGWFQVQSKFVNSLASELRKQGVLEVVIDEHPCNATMDLINQGKFDERQLGRIGKKYQADAVLFVEIQSHSAYPPLRIDTAMVMIDVREAIVTFSANGSWDANEPSVQQKFKQYACRRHQLQPFAKDMYLQSFGEFMEFVTADLVEFVSEIFRSHSR